MLIMAILLEYVYSYAMSDKEITEMYDIWKYVCFLFDKYSY